MFEMIFLCQKLLENQLKGPESFASRDDGYLYAGQFSRNS